MRRCVPTALVVLPLSSLTRSLPLSGLCVACACVSVRCVQSTDEDTDGATKPIGGNVVVGGGGGGSGGGDAGGEADLIFTAVWKGLERKYGEQKLSFPKEIMFLAGAPGAGKGVMTPFIMQRRGLTARPIEVSQLLKSPEAEALKSAGLLVGDRQVLELLLEALLNPKNQSGIIIDGFPRTAVQAECVSLLYKKMHALRTKYLKSVNTLPVPAAAAQPTLPCSTRRPTVRQPFPLSCTRLLTDLRVVLYRVCCVPCAVHRSVRHCPTRSVVRSST
jgi:hypothetical protein